MVPTRGTCASPAAMPAWAATTGRTASLYVALRIDPLKAKRFDTLTLKHPVPQDRVFL